MLHCLRTTARRRLLMQINNPTPSSLKRTFAQTASVPHQASDSPPAPSQPPTPKSQRRRRSTSLEDHKSMSSPGPYPGYNNPRSPRTNSPSGRGSQKGGSFRGHRDAHSRNNSRSRFADRGKDRDTLQHPLRDEDFIKQTYQDVRISAPIAENPKNSLANFANQVLSTSLDFKYAEGMLNKQKLWRCVPPRFTFYLSSHIRFHLVMVRLSD